MYGLPTGRYRGCAPAGSRGQPRALLGACRITASSRWLMRLAGVVAFVLAGSEVGRLRGSRGPGPSVIVSYALVPEPAQTPRRRGTGRRARTLQGSSSRAGVRASAWLCGVLMVLTCVAAVAVVWLGLWGVIRLEGTMGEARLPRDRSPAKRQRPGHRHPRPGTAARMTRKCSEPSQPRIPAAPSCPRPARRPQCPARVTAPQYRQGG